MSAGTYLVESMHLREVRGQDLELVLTGDAGSDLVLPASQPVQILFRALDQDRITAAEAFEAVMRQVAREGAVSVVCLA